MDSSTRNNSFWEELIDRLSQRDFVETHTKEAIGKMAPGNMMDKVSKFAEKYSDEFGKNLVAVGKAS